jgi:hypothetical protein
MRHIRSPTQTVFDAPSVICPRRIRLLRKNTPSNSPLCSWSLVPSTPAYDAIGARVISVPAPDRVAAALGSPKSSTSISRGAPSLGHT